MFNISKRAVALIARTGGGLALSADLFLSAFFTPYLADAAVPTTDYDGHSRQMSASADGRYLVLVQNYGPIWLSADYGATWGQVYGDDDSWTGVHMTPDAGKIIAVSEGYNAIIISDDLGQTWTSASNIPEWQSWIGVGSSADGQYITVSASGQRMAASAGWCNFGRPGHIMTSVDYGNTWSVATASLGAKQWNPISSSPDGMKLVAAACNDFVYISEDGGASWEAIEELGTALWEREIIMSADGSKITISLQDGTIYTSSDGGAAWRTIATPPRNWGVITSIDDGNKIVSLPEDGGDIILLDPHSPPQILDWSITPLDTSAVISFQTDEIATAHLHYGLSGETLASSSEISATDTFEFTLSDLLSCTDYDYYLTVADELDNSTTTAISTFQTSGCLVDPDPDTNPEPAPQPSHYRSISGTNQITKLIRQLRELVIQLQDKGVAVSQTILDLVGLPASSNPVLNN
jgi:photosystem II stability/assembly factor-like uncharacterized protein